MKGTKFENQGGDFYNLPFPVGSVHLHDEVSEKLNKSILEEFKRWIPPQFDVETFWRDTI